MTKAGSSTAAGKLHVLRSCPCMSLQPVQQQLCQAGGPAEPHGTISAPEPQAMGLRVNHSSDLCSYCVQHGASAAVVHPQAFPNWWGAPGQEKEATAAAISHQRRSPPQGRGKTDCENLWYSIPQSWLSCTPNITVYLFAFILVKQQHECSGPAQRAHQSDIHRPVLKPQQTFTEMVL